MIQRPFQEVRDQMQSRPCNQTNKFCHRRHKNRKPTSNHPTQPVIPSNHHLTYLGTVNAQPRTPPTQLLPIPSTDHVTLPIPNQQSSTPNHHITKTLRAIFRPGLRKASRLTPTHTLFHRHIRHGKRILPQGPRVPIRIAPHIRVVPHLTHDGWG